MTPARTSAAALAAAVMALATAAPAVALPVAAMPAPSGASNPALGSISPRSEAGGVRHMGGVVALEGGSHATAVRATAEGATAAPGLGGEPLPLPQPQPATAIAIPGLLNGLPVVTPDRLRTSRAPGPVDNTDAVSVALGPDGYPQTVQLVQRLRITGTGDYGIYERGPARRAEALEGTSPPVAKLGTVVWNGFSPGSRDLAARLTLDRDIEALRLPVAVSLAFVDVGGVPTPLGPGGAIPSAGTLTVTVRDQSAQGGVQVSAGAAEARPLAAVAEALMRATATPGRRPPVAGQGLPTELPAPTVERRVITVAASHAIAGTVTVSGTSARVSGPGVTPTAGGGRVAGTLGAGSVSFTVQADGPGELGLDLTARPTLDRRAIAPPPGHASWSQWAASDPSLAERRAATDTVVAAAATAVRVADFYPYLSSDLKGRASGVFRYTLAVPERTPGARAPLTLRRGPAALALVATGLILANGLGLRRLL